MEKFHERLKKAREEAGLSITQAAKNAKYARETWRSWENNKRSPTLKNIDDLAQVLGRDRCWLAFGSYAASISDELLYEVNTKMLNEFGLSLGRAVEKEKKHDNNGSN